MIQWLYRYVFRGIGVLLAIGMITGLILAIIDQNHRSASASKPATTPIGSRR